MLGNLPIGNANEIMLELGANMADAELANLRTGAAGFVAASSIERIPIEQALKDACRGFTEGAVAGIRGLYLRDPYGVLIELLELK
jgi:predicted TIM-barrel enzyme